jgi:hypothetical protein
VASRIVQIVPDVAELGPVHQALRAAQVGAGMEVGGVPSWRIAESGGERD